MEFIVLIILSVQVSSISYIHTGVQQSSRAFHLASLKLATRGLFLDRGCYRQCCREIKGCVYEYDLILNQCLGVFWIYFQKWNCWVKK